MNTKHYLILTLSIMLMASPMNAIGTTTTIETQSTDNEPTKAEKKAAKKKQKMLDKRRKAAGNHTICDLSENKFTALGNAIANFDNEEVERLLNSGVSASQQQGSLTPLAIAVQVNNIDAVRLLLNSKTAGDINTKYTKSSEMPGGTFDITIPVIVDAIEIGNPEVLQLILDKNPNVDFVYEEISSTNRKVVEKQSTPMLDAILNMVDIKADSKKGHNKYDGEAQFNQYLRVVNATKNVNRILTTNTNPCAPGNKPYKGAMPNISYATSLMMLINARMQPNPEGNEWFNKLVCAFIDRGVNKDYKYKIINSGYLATLKKSGIPAAQINLIKASDPEVRNVDCKFNSTILAHMLSKGWSIDKNGDNGVELFVTLTHLPSIKLLVEKGIDINSQNKAKQTILFFNTTNFDIIEELLIMGANPNIKGPGNLTIKQMTNSIPPRNKKRLHTLLDKYGAE